MELELCPYLGKPLELHNEPLYMRVIRELRVDGVTSAIMGSAALCMFLEGRREVNFVPGDIDVFVRADTEAEYFAHIKEKCELLKHTKFYLGKIRMEEESAVINYNGCRLHTYTNMVYTNTTGFTYECARVSFVWISALSRYTLDQLLKTFDLSCCMFKVWTDAKTNELVIAALNTGVKALTEASIALVYTKCLYEGAEERILRYKQRGFNIFDAVIQQERSFLEYDREAPLTTREREAIDRATSVLGEQYPR